MDSFGHTCHKSSQRQFAKEKSLIGVIGGSGLCQLPELEVSERIEISTSYGKPSELVSLGEIGGYPIAFLPRHGEKHTIPPHKVPYKANLSALKLLGVKHIIGTCVVGSLRKEIEPGAFVIPDQFINLTHSRDDTFEADGQFVHLPMAYPYCGHIRKAIADELERMKVNHHVRGTVVVVQGPRFSTIAESKMFALWGGDIVNMTQYPECYFARELGLCYGVVASVTDYDVGIPSAVSMQPKSIARVLEIFRRNTAITASLIKRLVGLTKEIVTCDCAASHLAEYYKLANSGSS